MAGRILIVEDEPIIALDLEQELVDFGFEVAARAQSADEALMAVEESLPDLALMDLHILGSVDGVETAKLLRDAYQIPSVFLTAHSDDRTVSRATQEMPYGYLTKPFQSRELKATIQVAMHKAKVDADLRRTHARSSSALDGMHEALLALTLEGDVQFINSAAEQLTGIVREHAVGRHFREVLHLEDRRSPLIFVSARRGLSKPVESFGLRLQQPNRGPVLVDLTVSPSINQDGRQTGYILTLRKAQTRLQSEALQGSRNDIEMFELTPVPMVQLDNTGHIVRVNDAMIRDVNVPEEKLVGRTLAGLSRDPDPRISGKLMYQLLQGAQN
jgi:PAS domain S-box-containing protein